jgi:hydrogenase expression/formation protein HypE
MAGEPSGRFTLTCPVPSTGGHRVMLAHGGGGRLTQKLIESVFLPAFSNPMLQSRHDGAMLTIDGARLALTTDSYVVHPLIFPGGTIGDLGINGTINDLAMCGARPLYLTAGFILEEGLEIETLRIVVESMRQAAVRGRVNLVAGDTKVVDKGKGDGIFLITSGVGRIESPEEIAPSAVAPDDAVIVSGALGAHGIAILSVREGLDFESTIESDTAPLWEPVQGLLARGIRVHCLRDLTRGGLSSALNEIAEARGLGMVVEEARIPVIEPVRAACEILGLDPLYVANEGRFVTFVPRADAESAVETLSRFPVSRDAAVVGHVADAAGPVLLRSRIGGNRVLDMLSGEQLPRIC